MTREVYVQGLARHAAIDKQSAAAGVAASADFKADMHISLVNLGPGGLKINFDADTTAAGAFTLSAGQSIDLPLQCDKLYWKADSDTVFTAVGV